MEASSALVLPVIDISPLLQPDASAAAISAVDHAIGRACTDVGFFYLVGHGVPLELQRALHAASSKFFSLDVALKKKVAMALGGKAWRGASVDRDRCACADSHTPLGAGWFPVGDELTSGRPDQKEGLYLGSEDGESPLPLHVSSQRPARAYKSARRRSSPEVFARMLPMRCSQGSNLWPEDVPELRPAVETYM